MDDEKIIKKLKELIATGVKLVNNLWSYTDSHFSEYHKHNGIQNIIATTWRGECLNLLRLKFGENSVYFQDFYSRMNAKSEQSGEFYQENVAKSVGCLRYTLDALESGFTDDLFYKKELTLLSDLLEQGYEFLKKDIPLAAVIYGRVVLETTIKEFARKNQIEVKDKKFDQIIIELKKREIISQQIEHSLRANYSLGSSFHNLEEFEKISKSEIKNFLDFLRNQVLTLQ